MAEGGLGAGEDRSAAGTTRIIKGLRQDAALRRRGDLAGGVRRLIDNRGDLGGGEAGWQGDRVLNNWGGAERVERLTKAAMGDEAELAGAQLALAPGKIGGQFEDELVADDPRTVEDMSNGLQATRRNGDVFGDRQRPWPVIAFLDRGAEHAEHDYQGPERQNPAAPSRHPTDRLFMIILPWLTEQN